MSDANRFPRTAERAQQDSEPLTASESDAAPFDGLGHVIPTVPITGTVPLAA